MVTKNQIKRYLAVAVVFIISLLVGGTLQSQAIGNDKVQDLAQEINSPGNVPRGIDFTSSTLFVAGGPDGFGYQWDDSVTFNWKDPASATPVTLSSADDGFSNAIDIGFSFPFYENTYTQTHISSNGFLSFGEGNASPGNKDIPYEFSPNNFIAPFWSDLAVGGSFNSGIASTMQGTDGNGDYLAVNYVNITKRFSPSDLLTFQIILYANGDIWFQYLDLNGNLDSTVGLEDIDGLDGLTYPSTLHNNLAIHFQRPPAAANVKVIPTFQSGLTESGTRDFLLKIRNTGALGLDTFNLTHIFGGTANPGNSAWLLSYWEADGSTDLPDTNGDSIPDTGVLAYGETKTVLVRLQPPSGGSPTGDYTTYQVTATSVQNSSKKSTASFQAAVPVGHFLGFGNSAGLDLVRVNPEQQKVFDVTSSGTNPSLLLARENYFYAWEAGTDLEYAVLSYSGQYIKPLTKLTNNSGATFQTTERSPSMAVTSNGHIGIVWVRRLFDPGPPFGGENYNVYFTVLNSSGEILVNPINVTNNGPSCDPPAPDCWQDGDDIDVPIFTSPVIMATSDNRFIISWIDSRILFDGDNTDIGFAVYNYDGTEIVPADDLKNGNPGFDQYSEPRILELPNRRMLIIYSSNLPGSEDYQLHFGVYSIANDITIGDEIQEDELVQDAAGRNPDSALLTDSNILIAWVNSSTNLIECTILNDSGSLVTSTIGPITLTDQQSHTSNFVSVTVNKDGYGLLGWFDVEAGNKLYYALVKSKGNQIQLITPPMISSVDADSILVSRSRTGHWNAPLPDWVRYFPLINKN